jgi:hypothetical protein
MQSQCARVWSYEHAALGSLHQALVTTGLLQMILVKVGTGFILVIAGALLALPGVPGPGIPLVIVGLLLLSPHFGWARRSLSWLRERTAHLRAARRSDR